MATSRYIEKSRQEAAKRALRADQTAVENAVRLGVSVATVYRWAKRAKVRLALRQVEA